MTELEPVARIDPEALKELEKHPGASATVWSGKARHRFAEAAEPLVTLSSAQSAIAERDARIAELEATIEQMKADHACGVADMATRFRAVNVERLSEQLGADVFALRDRAEAAEALLKEAGKVLEPFARYRTADGVTGMDGKTHLRIPDDHMLLGNMNNAADLASVDPDTIVTVGHFRAARSLASKIGVKDE